MILGDQLSDALPTLSDIDPERDVVLMAEVQDECTYVKHHKKKIVLVLSGMRHFAAALRERGVLRALDKLMVGRTTLLVTHRPQALRHVDGVLRLDCGLRGMP